MEWQCTRSRRCCRQKGTIVRVRKAIKDFEIIDECADVILALMCVQIFCFPYIEGESGGTTEYDQRLDLVLNGALVGLNPLLGVAYRSLASTRERGRFG